MTKSHKVIVHLKIQSDSNSSSVCVRVRVRVTSYVIEGFINILNFLKIWIAQKKEEKESV